jgi:hypothetical protein
MAFLVELRRTAAVHFDDGDGDVLWDGYGDVYYRDTDESDTLFLSLDGQAFDHYWDPYVISFSAPSYQTEQRYGGFVRMDFGQITLSPDTFLDKSEWPPPRTASIDVYYTATTEDAAIRIFQGNIYLESYNETSVTYELYAPTYAQDLLDEAENYDGDTVPIPMAFGTVTHVTPVRLPNADPGGADYPTYHLGGVGTGTNAIQITSFDTSAGGTKTKVTLEAVHGWSNGTSIVIVGTNNFDGTHTIESVSGATFVIPVAFPTDGSTLRLPIYAAAGTVGSFFVFDDGVPIQTNVINNGDGTFSLTAQPVGEVTISGTASDTTLTEVMDWATTQFGISTYDDSNGRGTSPDVSYWATSQMPLIDFVSDFCAFFTHYFYIKADQLYLCDMLIDNGTDSLDEFEYFTASYSAMDAVKQVKAEWTTRAGVEERLEDGITGAVYVKDYDKESVVTGDYPWGEEIEVEPYHDTLANITAALTNILTVMNKDTATISLPITTSLPAPGKKLTFSDNQMPQDMSTYIWARTLQFDFENDEVMISGEGVIT